MRILLRHSRTGLHYAGNEQWTEAESEAMTFENVTLAIDRATEARLPEVEVVMRFSNPPFEIPLKLVGRGG